MNVAFRNVPGTMDKAWGLDKAGLSEPVATAA
jgi:hypothetical protein